MPTKKADGRVNVEGLDEFRKALKELADPEGFKDLKKANEAASKLIIERARAAASSRQEQATAENMKAGKGAKSATVSLIADRSTPFAFGAEFGAKQDQERRAGARKLLGWNQFKPWRGAGRGAGYFLYPAVRSTADEVFEFYSAELARITKKAFPD